MCVRYLDLISDFLYISVTLIALLLFHLSKDPQFGTCFITCKLYSYSSFNQLTYSTLNMYKQDYVVK